MSEPKTLYEALSKFHSEMGRFTKEQLKTNPAFRSKYVQLGTILEEIEEPLKLCRLSFSQVPSGLGKLTTTIVHTDSGEQISGEMEMVPMDNKPQTYGGLLTYMKRYALVAMLGINVDEDDDGNAASGVKPKAQGVPSPIDPSDLPF